MDWTSLDAALFDLDGVLTRTATVHAAAWKELFDDFLRGWGRAHGIRYDEFDTATDYLRYIDGRRRYDGVDAFLRSRGIVLPRGRPDDGPERTTVCGLGNRKQQRFLEQLDRHGVEVFDDAVRLLRALRDTGVGTAVVSASENCATILAAAGLSELFDVRVDGRTAAQRQLPGKPAPDTFLWAAHLLGTPPDRAAVLEDAISGVEAGRAGGFALVIGVDRHGGDTALADHGAHLVVSDLTRLIPPHPGGTGAGSSTTTTSSPPASASTTSRGARGPRRARGGGPGRV